jgi:hypothetical protein
MSPQNNESDSALVSNHQRGSPSMNTSDDDRPLRLGRIGNPRRTLQSDTSAPDREAQEPRGPARRWLRPRRRLASAIKTGIGGAGYAASPLPHVGLLNSTRRVLIKAWITRHRGPRSAISQRTFATSNAMV